MQNYDADLHIHSPYSIAVSQNVSLETLHKTAMEKGLKILGTGDITQPDWRRYLKENLVHSNGVYSYKDLNFIIQTELEDNESIHHVVLLPDFTSAEKLQGILDPHVKNITGRWAGRPHVHKSPAEIVEIVEDVGGICGPAHAFTPFKAIFRQGKFTNLKECYGTAAKKLGFLELGLSADTYLADRMECLKDITFLSNSDAHSEQSHSLGREFNRFSLEEPSFDEIKKACLRRKGRKINLNVGLDPKLGKYNVMFCGKCRRRVLREVSSSLDERTQCKIQVEPSKSSKSLANSPSLDSFVGSKKKNDSFRFQQSFDEDFIHVLFPTQNDSDLFLKSSAMGNINCIACKEEIEEKYKSGKLKKITKTPNIKLGVSERINEIASWSEPHSPDHRPKYLDIIPLIEIIRKIKGIKSKTSKTVMKTFQDIISTIGTEYEILVDIEPEKFKNFEGGKLSKIIQAFRNNEIEYIPGGGGTFGEIKF